MSGKIDENARCAAFKGLQDPVTGEQVQAFAQNARENPKACGMEAIKFQPRLEAA